MAIRFDAIFHYRNSELVLTRKLSDGTQDINIVNLEKICLLSCCTILDYQVSLKDRLGIGKLEELWENFSAFIEAIESYSLQSIARRFKIDSYFRIDFAEILFLETSKS